MRRWEYWCPIKQPLGNCALAVFTRFVMLLAKNVTMIACIVMPYLHPLLLPLFCLSGCTGSRQKGESEGWEEIWLWYSSPFFSGCAFPDSHSMVIVKNMPLNINGYYRKNVISPMIGIYIRLSSEDTCAVWSWLQVRLHPELWICWSELLQLELGKWSSL